MTGKARVRGGAPHDADLLRLFIDLVGEYDRLCAAFPVSVASHELFDLPIPDVERWHRIVRTLALRKFVIGEQDAVRVDRVIDAYRKCLDHEDPALDEMADEYRGIVEQKVSLSTLEDILYGNLLHGEYERHVRNLAKPQREKDLAVWTIGQSTEFLVRNIRTSILVAARDRRLSSDALAAVNRVASL